MLWRGLLTRVPQYPLQPGPIKREADTIKLFSGIGKTERSSSITHGIGIRDEIGIETQLTDLQKRLFSQSIRNLSDARQETCKEKVTRWPSDKRVNFHFHEEVEAAMNDQANMELKAFCYYLSMAAYFGRVDVALPGCESFFMQMHHEEHGHALKFFNYVKMRGGCPNLCPLASPTDNDWMCPLHAFKTALQLEAQVGENLVRVNRVAVKHEDLNASDFIVSGFMDEQMRSIYHLGKLVTVLAGVGDQGLARYIFDRDLLESKEPPHGGL